MDDVQVKRAIQSAGERMGHAKVKDEQFRVIENVVRGRESRHVRKHTNRWLRRELHKFKLYSIVPQVHGWHSLGSVGDDYRKVKELLMLED
ncbi:hypothetical protein EMCRGX_G021970 [Ephydatia muelleri]